MADWFKFYCDGLDEPRFRYALRTLPEVCPVWLLILSECCRNKSDTLEWSGDEVDLIGWGEKTCTSPAMINEAIKLLVKIRYLDSTSTHITVRKWNALQSDYCRQIVRNKKASLRVTPSNSGKSTVEERRIEEKREDTKGGGSVQLPFGFPKTSDEAIALCALQAVPPQFVIETWNKAQSRGGLDAKGQDIRSWTHYVSNQLAYDVERKLKEKSNGHTSGKNRNEVDRNSGTANEGRADNYRIDGNFGT